MQRRNCIGAIHFQPAPLPTKVDHLSLLPFKSHKTYAILCKKGYQKENKKKKFTLNNSFCRKIQQNSKLSLYGIGRQTLSFRFHNIKLYHSKTKEFHTTVPLQSKINRCNYSLQPEIFTMLLSI